MSGRPPARAQFPVDRSRSARLPARLPALALAAVLTAATALGTPVAARAATAAPTVSAPAGVATGSVMRVTGTGFTPGRSVTLSFGIVPAGSVTAGSTGTFSGTVTVPSTVIAGPQPLAATEATSRRTATTTVSVRTDWTQPGGSAARTGANPAQVLLDRTTAAGSVVTWKSASTAGSAVPPVAAAGVLVTPGQTAVVARRTSDGSQLWRDVLGTDAAPVRTLSAVIVGSLVVVGTDTGELRALDLVTGSSVWTRRPTASGSALVTDLVAEGDLVTAMVVDYRATQTTSTLVAVGSGDGATRWSTSLASRATLAAAGGRLFAATQTGKLAALDATTGRFLWVRQSNAFSFGDVSVSGTRVLVATQVDEGQYGERGAGPVGLKTFDAATGSPSWSYETGYPQGYTSRASVSGDTVYLTAVGGEFSYYFDAEYAALDLATGTPRWTTGVEQSGAQTPPTAPVLAGGVMWTGSCGPNAKFLGFDTVTGAKLRDLFYVRCGKAVAVNSRVFVLDNDNVQALGLPTEVGAVRSLDDDDTGSGSERLAYTGSWVTGASTGSFGGGQHASTTPGSRVSVPFTGTGVRYWFSVQPDGGTAEVAIDGTVVGTVDQYASTRTNGLTSWTSPVLARGAHTLTITTRARTTAASTGNRVAVDRIDIAH